MKNNRKILVWATLAMSLFVQCKPAERTFKVRFDSIKEVSGKKFALKDMNPELPADWDGYQFVVLEYKIATAQGFQLGFTTDYGYNELRIMSYVPNA